MTAPTRAEQLRAIFNNAGVGIAVTGLRGEFIESNPRFFEILGYTPESLGERTLIDVTHPDDVAATQNRIRELLDGSIPNYILEKRYVRRDGSSVWCQTSVTLLRDDSGRPSQFIGIVEEITQRKEAEAIRDQLAAVVQYSDDAIITITLDGMITTWNPGAERMLGYAAQEVVGRPMTILLASALPDEEPAILPRLRRGERIEHYETTRRRKDGTLVEISLSVSPLMDSSARVIGASAIARDITRQKRVEEELRAQGQTLREMDQRKDEFLATLSHELRNPLAPIKQAALISRTSGATNEQKRWAQEVIGRQVQHMSLLLDDLLDVSRITRGTLELRVAETEVAAIVQAAVETAQPLIDAKKHHFVVQMPEDVIHIAVDPLRFAQVLANLLTNAAKYTDRGGRISLTASADEASVVIRVQDNGVGVSSEAASHIFAMFSQVRSTQDRSEGGLGIGLALAKGLTELHGGSLSVESAGVGLGSTFTVVLPRRTQCDARPRTHVASLPTASKPRRLLIADDNLDAADSLAILLRLDGHEVTVVHDGRSAVDRVRELSPNVALLDIGMPQLDGYEVAQLLRKGLSREALTLIAVTGWGQESDVERAMAAGFDYHFTKPIEPTRLAALLASHLPSDRD